jgi:hypothetical protein
MGGAIMPRAFISYSSKSKELVSALAQDFESAGHQVWFDHKLTGGQSWWDQILSQIRDCDLFVFALTPEALESYPCQLEYTYAHQLNKNVLPVLLSDGVSVALLPPELTMIQFVDYRQADRQAAFRLMNAIRQLPAPQPLPDPLPTPPDVPISYIGSLRDQIDAPTTLTFEEQAALIFRLRQHLQDGENPDDVLSLLRRLRRRDDLFARIAADIDLMLAGPQLPPPPLEPARPVRPAEPAPTMRMSSPERPSAAAPTAPLAFDWGWVTRAAAPGWALSGLVVSITWFLLPIFGMNLFNIWWLEGIFAFLAGGIAGYATHQVFRQRVSALQNSSPQPMIIGFAVVSLAAFFGQRLFLTEWFFGAVVGMLIIGVGFGFVVLNSLGHHAASVKQNAMAIRAAWIVAAVLFFLGSIVVALSIVEAIYYGDFETVAAVTIGANIIGNAVMGVVGCGLTLRALSKSAAVFAPRVP